MESKTQTQKSTDAITSCFRLNVAEVIPQTHTRSHTHSPTHTDRWAVSPVSSRGWALLRLTLMVNGSLYFTRNLFSPFTLLRSLCRLPVRSESVRTEFDFTSLPFWKCDIFFNFSNIIKVDRSSDLSDLLQLSQSLYWFFFSIHCNLWQL